MLGYLAGGVLCIFIETLGLPLMMFVLNAIHGSCMYITVKGVREQQLTVPKARFSLVNCCCSLVRPMMNHDFLLLFTTRFFIQMGIATVQVCCKQRSNDEAFSHRFIHSFTIRIFI